ncbi:hypothetical protein AB7M35_003590 [Amorphus suaedae]
MGKTLRVDVAAGKGKSAGYLRLGSYVSDETVFPGNFTGDKKTSHGVLMTTTGSFTLTAGKDGYVETDKSVDITVKKGAFSIEAADALSITSRSLYLQSGKLIEENSAVPTVPAGQAKIDTAFEFLTDSATGNINIICPASGYKKNISTGFEEIWGNQEKSNGNANTVVLGSLLDVPIGVYPSFDTWAIKLRGQETKNAVSASTAAVVKSGAYITTVENKSLRSTAGLVFMTTLIAAVKSEIASFKATMAELNNFSIEITQEEIDADLFGVRQDANATVDIRSV